MPSSSSWDLAVSSWSVSPRAPDRKAGQERLFVHGDAGAIVPGPDSQALRVVQRIRDEAHRFAITGHRKRRARRHNESVLETVPGLGPAKRRALLRHFGGMQGLLRAGVHRLRGGQRNRDNAGTHPL